jgi:hypothetical protein
VIVGFRASAFAHLSDFRQFDVQRLHSLLL